MTSSRCQSPITLMRRRLHHVRLYRTKYLHS
jgi:hypothetical protein